MISGRFLSTALLAALLAGASIPAAAQGIFDMPPIAGAAPDPAPAAPAAEKTPLDFEVSDELRKKTQAEYLAEFGKLYPDVAADLQDHDLIALMAQALEPFGLRVDNLGDAFTAWLLVNHGIVTGNDEDATPQQVAGTKKMASDAMLALPELQQMTDADKQTTSELLLLQAMINEVMVDARKEHNPSAVPEAIEEVRQAAKESGIDLDKFVLTPDGLQVVQ